MRCWAVDATERQPASGVQSRVTSLRCRDSSAGFTMRAEMFEQRVTTADLPHAWRDAIRAAELAERLAPAATEAAAQADVRALASAELGSLAERAAEAATRAAERARTAAAEAAELAASLRGSGIPAAEANVADMRRIETDAAAAYHDAEESAARQDHDLEDRPLRG